MRKLNQKIVIILISLISFHSFSQKRKIQIFFNNNQISNDTCRIKFSKLKCFHNNKKTVFYNYIDLKKIKYIEGDSLVTNHIVYSDFSKKHILLEKISNGKLSLFKDVLPRKSVTDNTPFKMTYIKFDSDEHVYYFGIDGGYYTNKVKKYLTDCPELIQKLKKKYFRKKNALDVVTFYNENCN